MTCLVLSTGFDLKRIHEVTLCKTANKYERILKYPHRFDVVLLSNNYELTIGIRINDLEILLHFQSNLHTCNLYAMK